MKYLSEAKTIIWFEITQDIQAEILKIDPERYIRDLLKTKKNELMPSKILPRKAASTLSLDQVRDHLKVDLIRYQQLIGKLMYLPCKTQTDIAFIVRQLSCYNSDPGVGHLHFMK